MHFTPVIVAAILSYTVSALPTSESYSSSFSSGSTQHCNDDKCYGSDYAGTGTYLIQPSTAYQATFYQDNTYCFPPSWDPTPYIFSGDFGSSGIYDAANYVSISYRWNRWCCVEGYVPSKPTSSYKRSAYQPTRSDDTSIHFVSESASVDAERIVSNGRGNKVVDKFDASESEEELDIQRNHRNNNGFPFAKRRDVERRSRQNGDYNDGRDSGKDVSKGNDNYGSGSGSGSSAYGNGGSNHKQDYISFSFFASKETLVQQATTVHFDGSQPEIDSKTTLITATELSSTEVIGHNRCTIEAESETIEEFEVTKEGWSKTVNFEKFSESSIIINCVWVD